MSQDEVSKTPLSRGLIKNVQSAFDKCPKKSISPQSNMCFTAHSAMERSSLLDPAKHSIWESMNAERRPNSGGTGRFCSLIPTRTTTQRCEWRLNVCLYLAISTDFMALESLSTTTNHGFRYDYRL